MAMWLDLTANDVTTAMPATMSALYATWLEGDPEREVRLAALTELAVEACRAAVTASNPWAVDSDQPASVPTSGHRHVLNMTLFYLGMEMGYVFPDDFFSLVTRADIWLRGVQAGTVKIAPAEGSAPRPSYCAPDDGGRILNQEWR